MDKRAVTGDKMEKEKKNDIPEKPVQKRVFPVEIKKTRQREEIFKILTEETEPVSAVEIYNRLAGTLSGANFAISTVYRVLTAFEDKGYVLKSSVTGSDMAYYEWNYGTHKHYAVCLKCHRMIPLKGCPFESAKLEADNDGFAVTGHKLELYGYCRECRMDD